MLDHLSNKLSLIDALQRTFVKHKRRIELLEWLINEFGENSDIPYHLFIHCGKNFFTQIGIQRFFSINDRLHWMIYVSDIDIRIQLHMKINRALRLA